MKRYSLFLIIILGMLFATSCEKDETRAVLNSTPTNPTLTVPSATLALVRNDAQNNVTFTGENADFGYKASVNYSLQVDVAGNNFKNPLTITSAYTNGFVMKVMDLNSKLLERYDGDVQANLEMRVAASVATNVPTVYSDVKPIKITPYGLPRLDLVGTTAKIQSAAGDGIYTGYVKLAENATFTLKDPDANKTYGMGASKAVVLSGATAFAVTKAGYYQLTVNLNTLKYEIAEYRIGLVGSATPNGWNAPDVKMDFDVKNKCWYVTQALTADKIKFRMNDDWGWNLGAKKGSSPQDINNLEQGGDDIAIATAGTYEIKLFNEGAVKFCTITKK